MKNFVFVACAVMIAVMAQVSFVAAQTDSDGIARAPQAFSSADFGVARIGILPTSNLYFLKELQRNIQRVFAFSAANKAKLEMKIANEKAAEIAKMQEMGVTERDVMDRALEGYEKVQERLGKALTKVKEGKESRARDEVLMRATEQSEKHGEFLQGLARTVGDKGRAREIIMKAEEAVRGTAEASLEKATDEIDRAQEFIAEVEIMFEEEAVSQEGATTTAPVLGQPQQLLAQAQERLDKATAAFDAEKYGEAYGQARAAIAIASHAKRILDMNAEASSAEGDEENTNEDGGAAADESGRNEGCLCAQVYSPVCGVDGKTYGNACEANCQKKAVARAGECTEGETKRSGSSAQENDKASSQNIITETRMVSIEGFAFSPKEITIKKGTKVTWMNKDAAAHQIASNPHPLHTSLPELASPVLARGESYSFTFQKTGTIGYHCHLHPSMQGKITVIE